MSEQKNQPRLEERYGKSFTRTMALGMGWMILCTGIIVRMGADTFSASVMQGAKIVSLIAAGICAVLLVRSLLCKVRLDENGVEVNNPLLGRSDFRWEELNTAAIVVFTYGKQSERVILLSTRPPEEVLTPAAMRGRASKHEQVRIPYTEKRREIVEHYLHMALPTIRL